MVSRELKRKRVFRALLAVGLACNLSLVACGTPCASSASVSHDVASVPGLHLPPVALDRDVPPPAITAYGLSVLAPAQAFPVPAVFEAPVWAPLHEYDDGADTYIVSGAPALVPAYTFNLQPTDPLPSDDVALESSGVTSARPAWFSSLRSREGATYMGRSWVYRKAAGPSLALGNITSNAPVWGSTASLGGIQLANWSESTSATLPVGKLRYSSVLGRLNTTDPAAALRALSYGPAAGSGSLRYGLTPRLTLEGQVQTAPSLNTLGWGTTYSAGPIGTFQAGAMQSSFDAIDARRYRFGYTVDIREVKLGYVLERISAGFGDLSTYSSGGISSRQIRNAFSAGVPLGHASIFSSTYTELREASVLAQQRFGFEQSVKLAHNVRFSLGADRDVVSGDYGMRANFSIPIDAFMQGHWLHW